VQDHVASSINAIVHVARNIDGSRFVKEVLLVSREGLNEVVLDGRVLREVW
jgi:hypothetical protein